LPLGWQLAAAFRRERVGPWQVGGSFDPFSEGKQERVGLKSFPGL